MEESKIPLELSLTLRQGTVYYFQHRDISSPLSHFFIVINASPCNSKTIILNVITSKVEERKQSRSNLPQETLVELSPSEYCELTKNSIVDCNSYKKININELVTKMKSRQIEHKKDLPREIVDRIVAGIHASPMIEPEIKRLVYKT